MAVASQCGGHEHKGTGEEMMNQNNKLERTCTQGLVALLLASMVFACGGEESLPADITDINDIPCPSCGREEEGATTEPQDGIIPSNIDDAQGAGAPDDATPGPSDAQEAEQAASNNGGAERTPGAGSDNLEESGDSLDEPIVELESVPLTFRFDAQESLLYVQVFKDETRLLSAFSHNHVMRAADWSADFYFDANDLTNCRITAAVRVEELRVDETAMRTLVQSKYNDASGRPRPNTPDYNQGLSDSDREQIRNSMLSVSQLNSLVYPEITLNGNDCSGMTGESGQTTIAATMTLRGTPSTVNLVLDYDFTTPNQVLIVGTIATSHAELGFEPYEDLGGSVANAQPLNFTFDLMGVSETN